MEITKEELNNQIDYLTSNFIPDGKITMARYEYLNCQHAISFMGIYKPMFRKNKIGVQLVDLVKI